MGDRVGLGGAEGCSGLEMATPHHAQTAFGIPKTTKPRSEASKAVWGVVQDERSIFHLATKKLYKILLNDVTA